MKASKKGLSSRGAEAQGSAGRACVVEQHKGFSHARVHIPGLGGALPWHALFDPPQEDPVSTDLVDGQFWGTWIQEIEPNR